MPSRRSQPIARSLRTLVAGLLLGVGLVTVPAAAPSPVAGVGPLPDCRFDDILTVPRDYDSGPTTLVDHLLTLGKDYVPPDLVPASNAGIGGGGSVRRIALRDLRALADAAAANGTPLSNISSYRNYRQQRILFNGYVRQDGYAKATTYSARPGHSEHQLGLTFDFTAPGDAGLTSNWEVTPTGGWMARNAWKFGWVMSYPKGKKSITCFRYEPWHYRYVGRDVAAAIHESGLTTREYLWEHYTQINPTTGEPIPSGSVAPSTGPSAAPSAGPTELPTPTDPAPTGLGPSLAPTSPPTSGVGTLFGVSTSVVIGLVLVLALLVAVVVLGSRRSRRARRSRGR
jgi:D-alanyl-D-alanine carboxypeptidase